MALRDDFLTLLREGDVTFSEVQDLEGASGDKAMAHPGHNLVLWSGLSDEMVMILVDMLEKHQLDVGPASLEDYHFEGCNPHPNLPIADDPGVHAAPHWLPVLLNLKH
jgi:hypothetical protein